MAAFNRKLISSAAGKQNYKGFRLMTFNVLAQGLSANNFNRCPDEALEYERRVSEVIKEISAFSANIICLQEVDMFNKLLQSLETKGYEGLWKAKTDSPCTRFTPNWGPDGSAIFYKKDTIERGATYMLPIQIDGKDCSQVIIACELTPGGWGKKILVVCLHLKAKSESHAIRTKQMKFILDFVASKSSDVHSVIICGDMNSAPTEEAHEQLKSAGFISTYTDVTGSEPEFTTCKYRIQKGEEVLQKKVEDYIYFKNITDKNCLSVASVLSLPQQTELGEGALPSFDYPSDHLSMITDFIVL